jgi:hypothetical protein
MLERYSINGKGKHMYNKKEYDRMRKTVGKIRYIGFEVPLTMYETVKQRCQHEDVSISQLCRRLLNVWLEEKTK